MTAILIIPIAMKNHKRAKHLLREITYDICRDWKRDTVGQKLKIEVKRSKCME
mgnify:CR=1 FL=1